MRDEKPRGRLERRAVDLGDPAARSALLDDVSATADKVFVLTEGVVGYLTNDDVAALADDLHARPHLRWWVLEYVSQQFRRIERVLSRRRRKQLANAPLQFHPDDWLGFFARYGWTLVSTDRRGLRRPRRKMGDHASRVPVRGPIGRGRHARAKSRRRPR